MGNATDQPGTLRICRGESAANLPGAFEPLYARTLLPAGVPAAMLFVRNPTGVSHSPAEHASRDDCLHGVRALTAVLRELAG